MKFIAVFSIVILCFVNSFAQERDFEIEVSTEKTNISKNAKEIPVTVKITNKAEEELKTAGLGYIEFTFSKCLEQTNCSGHLDKFNSKVRVPEKTLRANESVELQFDLMDLNWIDKTSSYFDADSPKNFNKTVSAEHIYFQAVIELLKGYQMDKKLKRKVPITKSFLSNTITVVIE